MPRDYSAASDYDGPSRADEARARRQQARRPLCDEDGCPTDEDSEGSDTTEDADEGEE
jgi:hypothetical protein